MTASEVAQCRPPTSRTVVRVVVMIASSRPHGREGMCWGARHRLVSVGGHGDGVGEELAAHPEDLVGQRDRRGTVGDGRCRSEECRVGKVMKDGGSPWSYCR